MKKRQQDPSIKLKVSTKEKLESCKDCINKFNITHDDIVAFLINFYQDNKNKLISRK